jgi:hypothetical protein
MYALVAARTREIGTLRALGFSRGSILTTFVLESTFLAMVGGGIGCLIALPANGITSAAGGPNFAEVAFAFRISGRVTGYRDGAGRNDGHRRRRPPRLPRRSASDHLSTTRRLEYD